MGMDFAITRGAMAAMREHAAAAHPHEACGLLLGAARAIVEARVCANVASDPTRHFEIDPTALIAAHRAARAGGPAILGYYHSHPTGDANPSATDLAMAAHDGRIWAIVGAGQVRFWHDLQQGFEPLSLMAE